MPYFERHFSLEQARAELPQLRKELGMIQESLRQRKQAELEVEPTLKKVGGNGGSKAASRYVGHQFEIVKLLEQIAERGIQVKDPARGLVDFPHFRDGREVLLCWLLGEDDIRCWHDLESGFNGRMPL